MHYSKLVIVLCSFMITSCGRSCQSKNIKTSIDVIEVISASTEQDQSKELAPLEQLQGIWTCYKYERDSAKSLDYGLGEYSDNFAKEFSKYIYLEFSNDTLIAMNLYKTQIKAAKISTKQFVDDMKARLTKCVDLSSDSAIFITPVEPYEYYWEEELDFNRFYTNILLNRDKVVSNNKLVLHYRDCFFFFVKDDGGRKSTCQGVPGDEHNFFDVKIKYATTEMNKVCDDFRNDYPFGAEKLLNEDNIKIIMNHNWKEATSLEVSNICYIATDRNKTGKFVLKITVGTGNTELRYYFTEEDGYSDDYQG